MNKQLKEIYDEYLNHSEQERIDTARTATSVIGSFLKESGLSDKECLNFYINIVRLFVSADKNCSKEEADLFNDILNAELGYEEFFALTNGGSNPEFIRVMDDIIDSMPEEPKVAICVLGLTFLASDGELSDREIAIFERILA